jgi:hypothetical protein
MLFDREGHMSEDDQAVRAEQEEAKDEVEAHRKAAANEEAGTEGDDDVEAHRARAGAAKKL